MHKIKAKQIDRIPVSQIDGISILHSEEIAILTEGQTSLTINELPNGMMDSEIFLEINGIVYNNNKSFKLVDNTITWLNEFFLDPAMEVFLKVGVVTNPKHELPESASFKELEVNNLYVGNLVEDDIYSLSNNIQKRTSEISGDYVKKEWIINELEKFTIGIESFINKKIDEAVEIKLSNINSELAEAETINDNSVIRVKDLNQELITFAGSVGTVMNSKIAVLNTNLNLEIEKRVDAKLQELYSEINRINEVLNQNTLLK